jgi:phospholipid-binding lipoprotein MlaA
MFAANEALDVTVIKPVARSYEAALPKTVQNGVANFYGNIADVGIGLNNALQGKVPDAINDFGRVMVNSSLGILGFMDVATDLGVEKHYEDFGLTLAHWGVDSGAYIVLPVFGPRTVRDSFGLVLDLAADPVGHYAHVATRNSLVA